MTKAISKAAETILSLLDGSKGLTKTKIANSLRYPRNQVEIEIEELLDAGYIENGPYNRLVLIKPPVKEEPKSDCKVCEHCGKGSKHWTDWDLAEGDREGNGACKNAHIFGGCVGEWTCNLEEQKIREEKANKKYVIYGGRLGYILSIYPQVHCPICQTKQVQIVGYLEGPAQYKCRHCKQQFSMPVKDLDDR